MKSNETAQTQDGNHGARDSHAGEAKVQRFPPKFLCRTVTGDPEPGLFLEAARAWRGFGLAVIPVIPDTKRTPTKWFSGVDGLSDGKITDIWTDRRLWVGAIIGPDLFIADADTPEALAALYDIEREYNTHPSLIIQTARGEHHGFRRNPEATQAQTRSYSTKSHPEAIDIKTARTETEGRSLIVLPPSGLRRVVWCEAETSADLSEAGQPFIDAIYSHNGDTAPTALPTRDAFATLRNPNDRATLAEAREILTYLNPDMPREDWLYVAMGLHDEFDASEEAYQLFDSWSSGMVVR